MSGAAVKPPPMQLDALTGLRGLAAWFVVFYHIRYSLTDILPAQAIEWLAKGYLAVDLFFMLSGFVMWLNYAGRFAENGKAMIGPFLWKRFARIWPLHALILLAMVAFAGVLIVTGRATEGYPLAELPLHLFLMQNWGLTGELTWNHPAWSISTEFAAYLAFPLLIFVVRWERLSIGWLVAALGILFALLHTFFAAQGLADLGDDIARTGLMRCLLEFTAGIALANIWQRVERGSRAALVSIAICAAILAAGFALLLPETMFAPAAIAALLLACAFGRGHITGALSARFMVWLGDTSYATYLMHFFAFILFKIAFVGADLQIGWGMLLMFVLGVQVLATVLYYGFEKPAQRWLNARPPRIAQLNRRRPA